MEIDVEIRAYHHIAGHRGYVHIEKIANSMPLAINFIYVKLSRARNPSSVLPYVRYFEHRGIPFDPEFVPLIEARCFDAARQLLSNGAWLSRDGVFRFIPPKSRRDR